MSLFLSTVDILTAIREELPATLYLSTYTLKLNTYLPPWKTVPFNKASEDPAQMQSNDRPMCNKVTWTQIRMEQCLWAVLEDH